MKTEGLVAQVGTLPQEIQHMQFCLQKIDREQFNETTLQEIMPEIAVLRIYQICNGRQCLDYQMIQLFIFFNETTLQEIMPDAVLLCSDLGANGVLTLLEIVNQSATDHLYITEKIRPSVFDTTHRSFAATERQSLKKRPSHSTHSPNTYIQDRQLCLRTLPHLENGK